MENDPLLSGSERSSQITINNVGVGVLSFPGQIKRIHLIFCHATGRCKEVYLKHIKCLRELGFQGSCTLIDARGHGDTKVAEDGNHNVWLTASDIAIIIKTIRIKSKVEEKFIGIGHSMGATSLLMAQILGANF
jgi:pimeloyl-ACP methyl ester carboxylesterase